MRAHTSEGTNVCMHARTHAFTHTGLTQVSTHGQTHALTKHVFSVLLDDGIVFLPERRTKMPLDAEASYDEYPLTSSNTQT